MGPLQLLQIPPEKNRTNSTVWYHSAVQLFRDTSFSFPQQRQQNSDMKHTEFKNAQQLIILLIRWCTLIFACYVSKFYLVQLSILIYITYYNRQAIYLDAQFFELLLI